MTESEQKEFSKLRSDNEVLREIERVLRAERSDAWDDLDAAKAEIVEYQAALESARAELAASQQLLQTAFNRGIVERALALEEAARIVETSDGPRDPMSSTSRERALDAAAEELRALAPLPASLVAVPRDRVKTIRRALRTRWPEDVSAALALLGEK